MGFHRISLLVVAMLFTIMGEGQEEYRLQTFGTRDGLLSPKIFKLKQDNQRLLWIGTEAGVSVYDGYSFLNHQYTSGHEAIGRILCITQDSSGSTWVGGDKGLFVIRHNSVKRVTFANRAGIAVECLVTDSKGNVWVGGLDAVYRLDKEMIVAATHQQNPVFSLTPYGNFIHRAFDFTEDRQHNIYVGSYQGVYIFPNGGPRYSLEISKSDTLSPVNSVAALSRDSLFWNPHGFHTSQRVNGKMFSQYTDDFLGVAVFKHNGEVYALTSSGVGKVVNGKVQPIVTYTAKANNALTALIDAEGNIWIGSWEGLLKYRKTSFRQFEVVEESHREIFSLLERQNGELLFGGNRGLIFSKKGVQLVPNRNYPPVFSQSEVFSMVESANNDLWFGSGYSGVSRLKNNKITNWQNDGSTLLRDNNCEELYRTKDGKILASTENGVTVIDPLADIPFVTHYPYRNKYSRYPELFGCYEYATGKYLFYGSQGIFLLNNGQLIEDSIERMPVKSLYITRIVGDKKGNVWVATQGKGLLKCENRNNRLRLVEQFDSRNGMSSDIVLSVIVDKNDNIWCGDYMSMTGVMNVGEQEQLVSFNENDGLLSTYYQTLKLEEQKDGTIWGLTSMGVFSFHPDSISTNHLAPTLLINEAFVNGRFMVDVATQKKDLSSQENSIQFRFTAISLTDPAKIRYAYRLKGLDTNWTITSNRKVDFNFLQPGEYTFELRACNNNNVWTATPLQYSFIIHPPFWQKWWFRSLVLLFIAGIVLLLFRRRIHAFKARAAIRQRMAELEAKAIRAQMNPHFIFNSLNAIQESIVLNDFDTSYQYLSKFSKLLRLVLNNSEKNFIPLQSEIEMNRLYLELESLRFKHSFSFTITIDEQLDMDMIMYPSLMLQPFIENAIWHGLMHKDGEKNLSIAFTQKGDQVVCVIEDNGIGRAKADAIKKQKLGSHHFESKGTDLTRQRIQLLREIGAMKTDLEIMDLVDDNNEPLGTRVTIIIPLLERK